LINQQRNKKFQTFSCDKMKKVNCKEFQKQNVPPHSIMFPPDMLEFYFAGALPHPTGACGFAETRETEGT
jgi:hypothetical protein